MIEEHADSAPTPEQEIEAKEVIDTFMEKFTDQLTRDVAEWTMEGFKKAEIQEALELDDTAYDTHTKRIRRATARVGKQESTK